MRYACAPAARARAIDPGSIRYPGSMTHVRARAVTTTYNYGANIKSFVRETPTCIVVETRVPKPGRTPAPQSDSARMATEDFLFPLSPTGK